jgi:mono/diheme cytochrome c family protein
VDLQADPDGDLAPDRRAPPPSHAWRILKAMGWTVQRPERRALERDEAAIARWVKTDWPRIRQKRATAWRMAGIP